MTTGPNAQALGLDIRSPESMFGAGSDQTHTEFNFSQGGPSHHASPPGHYEPDRKALDACLGGGSPGAASGNPGVRVCDLDPAVTGMEFVLT